MPSDIIRTIPAIRLTWRRLWPGAVPCVLTMPALLVCTGILIPFITAVRLSVQRGLDDYADLLTNAGFWNAVRAGLGDAAGPGLLELLLGFGLAALLCRPTVLNDFLARALLLPLLMAPAMPALMWKLLTGPGVAGLAGHLPVLRAGWPPGPTLAAAATLVVDVWVNTPWMMFLLLLGLRRLPRRRIEAARLDGVPGAFVLARVIVPALAPYVVATAALRLLESLRQIDLRYAMGGAGAANGPLVLRLPAYLAQAGAADAARLAVVLIVVALATSAIGTILVMQWRTLRGRADA
jgi:multiple sugar transport system permease protein